MKHVYLIVAKVNEESDGSLYEGRELTTDQEVYLKALLGTWNWKVDPINATFYGSLRRAEKQLNCIKKTFKNPHKEAWVYGFNIKPIQLV